MTKVNLAGRDRNRWRPWWVKAAGQEVQPSNRTCCYLNMWPYVKSLFWSSVVLTILFSFSWGSVFPPLCLVHPFPLAHNPQATVFQVAQCQLYCEGMRIVLSSININLDNYTYSPIFRLRQKGVNPAQTPLVLQWLRLQASNAEDGGPSLVGN